MAQSPSPKRPHRAKAATRTLRLEALMALLVLVTVMVGEVVLIRGNYRGATAPLSPASQIILRLTFGR